MCGIVGFVGRRNSDALAAMTRHLEHRGPDGEGLYENEEAGVHFGHRRLAVIDLEGGAQPMHNDASSLVLVFNGEIYNHLELRRELIALGHKFRTDHSDTEVLLHGYKQWGTELPARLNGMFAFAIHDVARARLFLARDRFGEKPLFYYLAPGLFAFASELSAFLLHPNIVAELDGRSVQKFFAYGYLPGRNALYRHACKLPGGGSLLYDLKTGQARESIYWRFRLQPDHSLTADDDERLAEELRFLLQQSVKRRLISDVPLGLFLSGGIDSSSILAVTAQQQEARRIDTFAIGFDEQSYDETPYAQAVAGYFGSNHRSERLSLGAARQLAQHALACLDEPMGDASLLPTYLLARFTRRYVTVALTGDGGDELFAGYDPFAALGPAGIYSNLVPLSLHNVLRRVANRLPRAASNMSLDFRLRRTLTGLSYPAAMWNPSWMSPIEPSRFAEFFAAPLPAEELYSEALELWEDGDRRGLDVVDRTLEFFTEFYLKDDILVKVDRAGMANRLEARSVFIDNDLVDFCIRLPNHFKMRKGSRKYLLKKAMQPLLPSGVLKRKKKGFGIPLSTWLREIPNTVPLAPVEGMRIDQVANAWRGHRNGDADERLFLWCWLALQIARTQLAAHAESSRAA
ncbi:MAG TPA: asparagine synthase (glutamine-hydrolyzing) [Rhizomicrobium sp.]|nr:asparagine synthase (glutamine-hydrolyzing) [Rhizomicrobium sp.]